MSDFISVRLYGSESVKGAFTIRKKDEIFLRKILVMLEMHTDER